MGTFSKRGASRLKAGSGMHMSTCRGQEVIKQRRLSGPPVYGQCSGFSV